MRIRNFLILTDEFFQAILRQVLNGFHFVIVDVQVYVSLYEEDVVYFMFAEAPIVGYVGSLVVYASEVVKVIQRDLSDINKEY